MKAAWKRFKEHAWLASLILAVASSPFFLTRENGMEMLKDILRGTESLVVSGNLKMPLLVLAVVIGIAKLGTFIEKHRKWISQTWKEITGQAKREREEKKREETQARWRSLVYEMGFHVGETDRVRVPESPILATEYRQKQMRLINLLRAFGFSMPSGDELRIGSFLERWRKFLEEFFEVEKIHQLYPNDPPTEEKFLTLWDRTAEGGNDK